MTTAVIVAVCAGAALANCSSGSAPRSAQSPPTSEATSAPRAREPVPPNWLVYRGSQPPFALAYPKGTTVDDSGATVGEVTFALAGKGPLSLTIDRGTLSQPAPSLDTLRARLINYAARGCESGRQLLKVDAREAAGLTFTTATVRCAAEQEQPEAATRPSTPTGPGGGEPGQAFYLGVAVKGGARWTFTFRCDADDFFANMTAMDAMLRTLDI